MATRQRVGASPGGASTAHAAVPNGRALAIGRDVDLEVTNKTPDLLVIQDAPAESDRAAARTREALRIAPRGSVTIPQSEALARGLVGEQPALASDGPEPEITPTFPLRRWIAIRDARRSDRPVPPTGPLLLLAATSAMVIAAVAISLGFDLSLAVRLTIILVTVAVGVTLMVADSATRTFVAWELFHGRNRRGGTRSHRVWDTEHPPWRDALTVERDEETDSLLEALSLRAAWDARNRRALQTAAGLVVLLLTVALPATLLWWADDHRFYDALFAVDELVRLTAWVFIALASALPAILFFFFERSQTETLRRRLELQIFRLDPSVRSMDDLASKHGSRIAETFGDDELRGARLLGGSRVPVLLATLALIGGWISVLRPHTLDEAATYGALIPHDDPISFAFLGAFFFSVYSLLRRYSRNDLRPKAYSRVTVRIVTAVVAGWVLELILRSDGGVEEYGTAFVLAVAFAIGVVPEELLFVIRSQLRQSGGRLGTGVLGERLEETREKHPLTKLEGIDAYDRFRLADEGITSVHGLADCNLIDLMIETRIPAPTMTDWVDQAILYVYSPDRSGSQPARRTAHATAVSVGGAAGAPTGNDAPPPPDRINPQTLRKAGIRTATDLIDAITPQSGFRMVIAKRLSARLDITDEDERKEFFASLFYASLAYHDLRHYRAEWAAANGRDPSAEAARVWALRRMRKLEAAAFIGKRVDLRDPDMRQGRRVARLMGVKTADQIELMAERLCALAHTLSRQEWITRLRYWRSYEGPGAVVLTRGGWVTESRRSERFQRLPNGGWTEELYGTGVMIPGSWAWVRFREEVGLLP